MAHSLLKNVEADGWERLDFPIICESCLGDNPYVRMTRADYDKECKICTRPFIIFRWRPGRDARFKKSEICQTCSKLKNVCQVCLLDLEYGLPVQAQTIDELHSLQKKKSAPTTSNNGTYGAAFAITISEEERHKQQLQSISASLASLTRETGPNVV
ncbi:hypothetical protein ACFX13_035484 [Malus domestica]|uniref:zinc finger CCCH domain-containing protein 4-like n=1 Tax=Malus domestica TaxID=3750 RepID=UPI0004992475|nr:zinc finger CCCH domain-containing protein 4-like [Malus domestica]